MNHQWRYFYPHYPYVHYPQTPSIHMDAPKSFSQENHAQQKESSYDLKIYHSILKSMEQIHEKLHQLEEENKALQEEVENMKPLTIENINYKIQDLHVQDLSGNLMVGLTALSDAEELKKLLEENDPITFNEMDTAEFENAMMNKEKTDEQNEEG
ncbi:hypothetical protein [Virgibacillus sp. YIM 98842]|uniref:hypothetical protein n=1 Tax=Virgibacillus sp. YIM 98842 TaxID=2663533 RepID=UPI0013D9D8E8|nr:hypothetical protein [Virgibacillus sp. YIM 98842]